MSRAFPRTRRWSVRAVGGIFAIASRTARSPEMGELVVRSLPQPSDVDAEASVLGAILLEPDVIGSVAGTLSPGDFWRENHAEVYAAAVDLWRKGSPIDNITLAAELEERGSLERVGGRAHLALLEEQTPTAKNVGHYVRIVQDKAVRRHLLEAGQEIIQAAQDPGAEASAALHVVDRIREAVTPSRDAPADRETSGQIVALAPFPLDLLPRELRDLSVNASAAFGYPAEFVAVPALSALAVAIGGSHALQIMTGWVSRPIVWTVVIAPPGSAKSPALELAVAPFNALEREWAERWEHERAEHEGEVAALGKGEPVPPPPARQRCRTSDANIPALSRVLAENPDRGIAWVANEVASIIGGLDQFKRAGAGAERPRFLELWDGADWSLDRIERGSIFIRRPLVSVMGGLQPDLLHVLSGPDGLGARFLRTYHPNAGLARARADAPLPDESLSAWEGLVRTLIANQPPPGTPPRLVSLEPRAMTRWAAWQDELRGLYGADSTSTFGQEVIGKGMEQLHRLALVLHCASHPDGVPPLIDEETIEAAAALVRYFVHQALACQPEEPSAAADRQTRDLDAGVARILRWIQRRRDPTTGEARPWATASDIKRAKIAGLRTAAEVDRVLDRVAEIYPGSVVEGRAPGATSTGRVGRIVYLPGADAGNRGASRHSGTFQGAGDNVGIVGIVGSRARRPEPQAAPDGPPQVQPSNSAVGDRSGQEGDARARPANVANNANEASGPGVHDAGGGNEPWAGGLPEAIE